MLPDKALSIVDLLKYTLPIKRTALVLSQASEAYSHVEPNEDSNVLATRPVPPKDYLDKLETTFGQAWFDGARSIADTRYKDSRLPLLALGHDLLEGNFYGDWKEGAVEEVRSMDSCSRGP
jgi:hypothetical protein